MDDMSYLGPRITEPVLSITRVPRKKEFFGETTLQVDESLSGPLEVKKMNLHLLTRIPSIQVTMSSAERLSNHLISSASDPVLLPVNMVERRAIKV